MIGADVSEIPVVDQRALTTVLRERRIVPPSACYNPPALSAATRDSSASVLEEKA